MKASRNMPILDNPNVKRKSREELMSEQLNTIFDVSSHFFERMQERGFGINSIYYAVKCGNVLSWTNKDETRHKILYIYGDIVVAAAKKSSEEKPTLLTVFVRKRYLKIQNAINEHMKKPKFFVTLEKDRDRSTLIKRHR